MNPRWRHLGLVLIGTMGLLGLVWLPAALKADSVAAPFAAPTAPGDVVINEVAWAGTTASTADEWIELYNNTPYTIPLSDWHLTDNDNLNITLGGDIAPYSHYLIERTDDTAVLSVTADLIAGFGGGLSNTGQALTLTTAAGEVIDLVNTDGGGWPAGNNTLKATMERINPIAPGDDVNWADNNGVLTYGWDADGNPLSGTARMHNSVYNPPLLADLHVTQNGPGRVTAGESVTYTVWVRNLGAYTAAATLLTDTLNYYPVPSSTLLLKQEQRVVWDIGALPPAAQRRFTVTASIPLTATGAFVNRVEATTTSTETMLSNNTAVLTTTVQPLSADLAITKTGPEIATWGDAITYTLTLHNVGQLLAQQCVLTDTLPEGVTYVRQETEIPGVAFTATGQTLVWTFDEIGSGAQHVITVGAQVQETAPIGVMTNTAIIACAGDANPADNHAAWPAELVDLRRPQVLISGVLYQGYQSGQPDDAIRLTNMSPFTAALENWKLCKNDSDGDLQCRALPTLLIPALGDVWITQDAAAFAASFGFQADYAMGSSWLAITNDDELLLRDAESSIVDALVYNDGMTPFPGWIGPSLRYYATPKGQRGQILARIPDEVTGLPISDTNTATDWLQYTGALTTGKQVLYPGWDFAPLFWPLKATEPATVVVGIAPDNAFEVISQTLMQAREAISIEIYALRHPALIEALVQKAEAGVQVTLLLEGDIFGIGGNTPEWQTELYACQRLEATGHGACWFMIHDTGNAIYNRYQYLHAKLVIVDRRWVVVGSQNFTLSGLPSDDKTNGTVGSRGAVIATTAPSVIARAAEIFAYDCDPAHHNDLLRWNSNPAYADKYGPPLLSPDLSIPDGVSYTVRFPTPLTVSGDFAFELFTAPDAALRQSDALLGLVNRAGAGDTILVQQAYEYVDWGADPETAPNLRLWAYLQAARRGAKVRLFVNGKSFVEGYDGPPEDNLAMVNYVNQIAAAEHLNLKAALGNTTEDGIHNKMVLIHLHGDGKYSHVGSINGSESSSKINREAALQVKSDAVYDYLAAMFNFDWYQTQPIYLPVVLRAYAPPAPPVEYLVVSEVYYSGDANAEWVELYNPTQERISLNGYQIGDYDGAGYLEGMYTFPANAVIPANGVILVAGNGKAVYPYANFEFFDHNADIPNLTRVGGDGDWALGNTGDQVLLFNPAGQLGDAVVWGMATYPGIVAHPGVITWTHSLERYPAYYDTDDCSFDFRDRYPPSPGALPTD